jgi:hypothetical protein
MGNHLKFCSCAQCRAGRHRPGSKARTRLAVRAARHAAKQAAKHGHEAPPAKSVPYTD